MNRIGARSIGPPSKATSSTLCQKCLKRGHYSYECTSKAQERPYAMRPSRTQQLLNPKLQPKLASDEPNTLLRREGVADEELAKIDDERGRKRRRLDGDDESLRSNSSSLASVSTISTNLSRSPSPAKSRRTAKKSSAKAPGSEKEPKSGSRQRHRRRRRSRTASSHRSSPDKPGRVQERQDMSQKHSSPSTRHGRPGTRSPSPPRRESHRRRSRSPSFDGSHTAQRRRRASSAGQQRGDYWERAPHRAIEADERPQRSAGGRTGRDRQEPQRNRSLSPYSKRLAMTQAMNMGR